jgi:hypothetical protein
MPIVTHYVGQCFFVIVRDLEVTCPVVSTVVPHIGQHFVLVGDSEVTCLSVSLVVSHFIRRFDSVGDLEPLEPFDPSWRTTVDSVSTPLSTLRSRPRSETNPILRGGKGRSFGRSHRVHSHLDASHSTLDVAYILRCLMLPCDSGGLTCNGSHL